MCLATAIHNVKWLKICEIEVPTYRPLSVFQDWKHILFLTTGHTGANENRMFTVDDNSVLKVNPFKPEFTIVIYIHYKPRIALAILNL